MSRSGLGRRTRCKAADAIVDRRRRLFQRPLVGTPGGEAKDRAASEIRLVSQLAEIERTRAGFAQEREAILAEAHAAAERAWAAHLEVVAKEAASLEAAATAAIEKEKAEVNKAWSERATQLAVEIAARLVARLDSLAVRAAFLDLREHMASGHKAMRVYDAPHAPPDRPRLRD